MRHDPFGRVQLCRGLEVGLRCVRVVWCQPDLDLAAECPRGSEPAGRLKNDVQVLPGRAESTLAIQRNREPPARLGRPWIGVYSGLGGDPGILEMSQPPQRLGGEDERSDPNRGRRILQVAMGGPECPEGMLAATTRVFLQRLQSTFGRSGCVMPVLGGNEIEPPGCSFLELTAHFQVRFPVRDITGSRAMGWPRDRINSWGHIIAGHMKDNRFSAAGGAHWRTVMPPSPLCPAPPGAGRSVLAGGPGSHPGGRARPRCDNVHACPKGFSDDQWRSARR